MSKTKEIDPPTEVAEQPTAPPDVKPFSVEMWPTEKPNSPLAEAAEQEVSTPSVATPIKELWKDVVGLEGCYQVSSHGRVRSIDRISGRGYRLKGKILSQHPAGKRRPDGTLPYLYLNLGNQRSGAAHVLMAEAFLGPKPSPGHQVAHFDGNSKRNLIGNLRWATTLENIADQKRHGTLSGWPVMFGDAHGRAILCDEFVIALRALSYTRGLFSQLAYILNVSRSTIARAYTGKMWRDACQSKVA